MTRTGPLVVVLIIAPACGGLLGIQDRYYDASGPLEDASVDGTLPTTEGGGRDANPRQDGAAKEAGRPPSGDSSSNDAPAHDAPAHDAPAHDASTHDGSDAIPEDGGSACPTPCTQGTSGVCAVACGQDFAAAVALDSSYVFWTTTGPDLNWTDGAVKRANRDGSQVVTLAAVGGSDPVSLAVGGGYAAFANFGSGNLESVPTNGGDASVDLDAALSISVASNGAGFFFEGNFVADAATVERCPWGQLCDRVIASGQNSVSAVVADSETVYWTTNDGHVWESPTAGPSDGASSSVQLASGAPAFAIAIDGTNVYWATEDNRVWSLPRSNPQGTIPTSVVSATSIGAVAVLAGRLYYTDTIGGVVAWVNADGSSEPTVIASEQSSPAGIAVDAANVFWTTGGTTSFDGGMHGEKNGTVMRAPIPP